jgi:hypothetical protein
MSAAIWRINALVMDLLGVWALLPRPGIDGPVLGGQHEPRTGPGRDALDWPLLQRGDESILR